MTKKMNTFDDQKAFYKVKQTKKEVLHNLKHKKVTNVITYK